MEPFVRISKACNVWVERSLALLGLVMAAVVLLQVICRYIFNNSLFWSEELARYLLIWLTFLGATSAYYRQVHPGIDILTGRLAGITRKASVLTVHFVSLTLFWVMIYHGSVFAHFVRLQITPAMGLPKWIVFSIIPFSGTIFLLHCLALIALELVRPPNDR